MPPGPKLQAGELCLLPSCSRTVWDLRGYVVSGGVKNAFPLWHSVCAQRGSLLGRGGPALNPPTAVYLKKPESLDIRLAGVIIPQPAI